MIGIAQLAAVGNYNFQRLQRPGVKEIASTISDCAAGKTILAADPYVAIELAYYLPSCDIYFHSEWPTLGGGYAPLSGSPLQIKDVQKELADQKEVVYVYYGKPLLELPSMLRQTDNWSRDDLHVTSFTR